MAVIAYCLEACVRVPACVAPGARGLTALLSVLGITVLMTHHEYPDFRVEWPIDYREPYSLGEVKVGARVKRIGQASSERSLESTSGPDTGEDSPLSISASRRAASSSQALSRALSASRLATTRSSRRARSAVGRRRISSSSDSTGRVMAVTVQVRATSVDCHKSRVADSRAWAKCAELHPTRRDPPADIS